MGRYATGVNLLAFSVAMLSQKSHRGKLAHLANCLHLGVSQVASECTSGLNVLMVYLLLDQKQSLEIYVDHSHSKDNQLVSNCNFLFLFS